MDKTPRTDAKWREVSVELPFVLAASDPLGSLGEIVPVNFARQLETELFAANAQLAEAKNALRLYGEHTCRCAISRELYKAQCNCGFGEILAAMDQTEQKR